MFTKRTLYGYWGCQSLHNCQYSVFPKITDTYSVPLHIFQMEVEVNPQSFRENEGKIDPILYLVGIVRCQTVLIWETALCALILCYFRSLCIVLCNTGWSKMSSRNWWGCHLDILQKLDVRKPTNITDALELLLCLTRRDHQCSVFFNVREIKQFLDITVLCYVINNTKWWTLFQTQLYSMRCLFLRNISLSKIRHVNKFNNLHSCLLPYLNTLFSLFGFKPLKHKVCLNNF